MAVEVLVRGAIAVAGAVAVFAASGCGGGTATTGGKTVEATTTTVSTIGVPTHVFVMNSGSKRLVKPSEFSYGVHGTVAGSHMRWTDWGEPAATASGAFSDYRFFRSNRVRFQGTLTLTRLRVCGGAEYYTHAELPVPSSPTQPSAKPLPTPCG